MVAKSKNSEACLSSAIAKVFVMTILFVCFSCENGYDVPDRRLSKAISIFPDYTSVTFPRNIAPANFKIRVQADAYQVTISCQGKVYWRNVSTKPDVKINEEAWKSLLNENPGKAFKTTVGIKTSGQWTEYRPIINVISRDTIDSYLVYRLIYPGYELWNQMGIYQRNLATFDEVAILDNRDFGRQCVNCHTFNRHTPREMMIHVRGKDGGTLISRDGIVSKVKPRCNGVKMGAAYASWHPSGRFIAYSLNDIQQFFHSSGRKPIEVADLAADLAVYDIQSGVCITSNELSGTHSMETFPSWSPDGKWLYFCRGNAYTKGVPLDSIRYDLYRVSFDSGKQLFGKPECLYASSAKRRTVSLPRVSPNGRYVLFVEFDYGNFAIWHPEADLSILDLETGKVRKAHELNSSEVESFHTWSSTGRWVVFSSKRMDGGWTRPYFAHFDSLTGLFTKPFVLPQSNPDFYGFFMYSYNLPELITSPISNAGELLEAIGYDKPTP